MLKVTREESPVCLATDNYKMGPPRQGGLSSPSILLVMQVRPPTFHIVGHGVVWILPDPSSPKMLLVVWFRPSPTW